MMTIDAGAHGGGGFAGRGEVSEVAVAVVRRLPPMDCGREVTPRIGGE